MNVKDAQVDVRRWRDHVGLPNATRPVPLAGERVKLHQKLIAEECEELNHAIDIARKISAGPSQLGDVAKEAADVIFVVLGAMCEMGIDLEAVWDAVVASNMTKTGAANESGKIVKGPAYRAPDTASIIRRQLAEGSF
jgi:predicted HAD superfamily Cof-like phosphohydrolase